MKCPECESVQYKESRQCPLHEGKPVCIDCCIKCGFYKNDNFYPCGFYIKTRLSTMDKELMQKKELIILKKELIKYQNNHIVAGYLKGKIENLESKLNRK